MIIFQSDGKLEHHGVQAQLFAQLVTDTKGVCTGAVTLVDEGQSRNVVPAHLAVNSDRLTLDSRYGAEHQDRSIEHSKGTFHLHGEIDVARGVDDVDVLVFPFQIGRSGLNRDTTFTFEFHGVHGCSNAVFASHLMDGVNAVGVEEDPLSEGRLAAVDVGADANVAHLRNVLTHLSSPRD